jgi:hypothetical protein
MNVFSLTRYRAVREAIRHHAARLQLPRVAERECVDHACKRLRCGKSAGVAIAEAKSLAARMRQEWQGGAA